MDNLNREYSYTTAEPTWSNQYIWPALSRVIDRLQLHDKRVFEIGCGNGATANFLSEQGFEATGIDSSISGIEVARNAFPHLNLHEGSAYDDLAEKYGKFPLVVSLEVIEHCFYPRKFAQTLYDLIARGGQE
jgi:2-polyprenyl-6-hydroxyphenyl methylase/3-demethylubiquinone-9 3-methyltransferase